ncbi:MAG: hypothetical protein BMS9Abin28_0816 [Anaerolineae bacterium]|nr:MAG: hypothetical protein BMS9Abin28_0816 [Anaerolineae bacterium]
MNKSRLARRRLITMVDVNILPERYRRRKLTLVSAKPWLFLLAYLLVLIPAVKVFSDSAAWLNRTEADLDRVQTALDQYRPLAEEKSALEMQIAEVRNEISQVEIASQSATIQTIVWSDLLRSIIDRAPAGVELAILDQSETRVRIVGVTDDHRLALRYADELDGLGLFFTVTVDSLVKIIPPEPDPNDTQDNAPPYYEFEITLELFAEPEPENAQ